jgi:hypothetical protein
MLRVKCPQCAKELSLKPETAGKTVRCPNCTTAFKTPAAAPRAAPAKAPAAKPASEPAAAIGKAPQPHPDDDFNPYGFKADVPPPDAEALKDDRIDEMVIMAQRQKARNKAWEQIGMPAKFIKRGALSAVVLWIVCMFWITVCVVLYLHKLEQLAANPRANVGFVKPGEVARAEYVWPLNELPRNIQEQPGLIWGVSFGVFVVVMAIYGVVLTGAEAMKKLEGYRWAMTSAIISCIIQPPIGLWALLILMRKEVKYEFLISARRNAGVADPYAEEEIDEDEDEEDDDEDEDEDDEDQPRPRKLLKRG